jgi:hypothetical protein
MQLLCRKTGSKRGRQDRAGRAGRGPQARSKGNPLLGVALVHDGLQLPGGGVAGQLVGGIDFSDVLAYVRRHSLSFRPS